MRIDKVGFALQGSKIHATIFGNIALGGLTLSLINLGVTSPISNPAPSFTLDGLGLDYRNGAVEIGGALMRSTRLVEGQEASVFSGFCVLKTRTLSMQVAASFCKMDKATSLFVYGALLAPLGGPAFFMVTGLAAGFGLHRRLIMPELADMPSFPLVATVMHKDGPAPFETMLPQLDACLPPASGENFFCIGVKFTTFKIIESFALLAVQFGTRTEIDVLGLSELTVPPGVPAGTPLLAKADLALKAVFLPDEGTLMVRAALTPDSYVLSPDCHLTGGFAMSSWFAGPYAGQFVLSIGGYHPAFRVPAHFPQDIQRLGFNWIVSGSLTFKGEMYFALTGNCLMAGGAFLAAYEGGSARAWFGCGADFIVTFKPFHYDATLYIDMGVDVTVHFFGTHHFSLRAHADLHLWGPPLAGHAHISLKVIGIKVSFDADFGSSRPLMLPIDWAEFEQSFLPPTKEICAISIVEGLICEAEEDGCKVSVVNPHTLRVQVESAVPSEMITLDGEDITGSGTRPSSFNIYPMGLSNTPGPSLDLAIAGPSKAFVSAPVRKPAPAGLWGQPVRVNGCYLVPPDLNHDALVPSLLHGLGLSAGAANATSSHCVNRDDLIHPDPRLAPGTWRWQAAPDAAQRVEMTAEGLNDALRAANAARDSLIRDLNLAAVLRDLGEDSSLGLNAMPSKAA